MLGTTPRLALCMWSKCIFIEIIKIPTIKLCFVKTVYSYVVFIVFYYLINVILIFVFHNIMNMLDWRIINFYKSAMIYI